MGLLLLCVGCTYNHTVTNTRAVLTDLQLVSAPEIAGGRDWVLPRNTHWFVAVSTSSPDRDGDFNVSRSLAAALRQEFAVVTLTPERSSVNDALKGAQASGANFMVYPKFLYHGDGAYSIEEWQAADLEKASGRDTFGVQLLVYDVPTAKIVDSIRVTNKESWLPGINAYSNGLFDESFVKFAQRYAYQQRELPR